VIQNNCRTKFFKTILIMKRFSFIHTADLHLDNPFKGIAGIDKRISSELSEATFNTYNKIIDLCVRKQVDFLIISGDIYNEADRSLRAQIKFKEGLERLSEVSIPVYIVHGNHDPLDGWSAHLDWPENVHIFKGKSVEKIPVKKGEKHIADVYGISFHKREIKTNLALKFPEKTPLEYNQYTIGVLHCTIGKNTGHEPYAPCTTDDLISRRFDYWALGHIHKKTIVNDDNPVIVYPGNPQGLNPKETGQKGCFFVHVDEDGKSAYEFIEVDSIRWFVEKLSVEGLETEKELISSIYNCIDEIRKNAGERQAICRIILTGRSGLHAALIRKGFLEDLVENVRDHEEGEKRFVWVESIINEVNPTIDREALLAREDFIGDLVKLFEETYHDAKKREELKEFLEPLFSSRMGRKLLEEYDDEHLLLLIKKAEALCLDKLIGKNPDEI